MKFIRTFIVILVALGGFNQPQLFAQYADMVLTGGKIFTSEKSNLYVEAIAVRKNKIIAVGTNAEIEKLADAKTKKIELKGKTVIPGFNNAHDHLGWAINRGHYFTSGFSVPGPDKQTVSVFVKALVQRASPGEWIGGMIGLTIFNDQTIRNTLDSIAPANPVQLQIMWGHGVVLNTYAMKLLNIAENEPDPLGGWYTRKHGSDTLTGAFYEYAQWPALQALAASQHADIIQSLQETSQAQIERGVTSVQHMNYFPPSEMKEIFTQAKLAQRIRIIPFPGTANHRRETDQWKKVNPQPAPGVYVSGVKYLIDGTPFDKSCLMKTAYSDSTGWYGRTNFPTDTIKQILWEAYSSNTQLLMHIVGDSTLAVVLSMMKLIGTDAMWRSKRVRIEHNFTGSATVS